METEKENLEVMVEIMEELTEAATQELLQKYSEEKYGVFVRYIKAGRLCKEAGNKYAKFKGSHW